MRNQRTVIETQGIASLQDIILHLDGGVITETCVETQCLASQWHEIIEKTWLRLQSKG